MYCSVCRSKLAPYAQAIHGSHSRAIARRKAACGRTYSSSRITPPGFTTRRSSRNAGTCCSSVSTQNRKLATAASNVAFAKSRLVTSIRLSSTWARAVCKRDRARASIAGLKSIATTVESAG
jgi:hypothetical protein